MEAECWGNVIPNLMTNRPCNNYRFNSPIPSLTIWRKHG